MSPIKLKPVTNLVRDGVNGASINPLIFSIHSKWGDGRIVAISGEGEDAELTIAFPGEGIKKFVQKYAPILKL